jgi:hypothetical protein
MAAIYLFFINFTKNWRKFLKSKAKIVYNELQADVIAGLISHKSEQVATAGALIVQNMIYSITDLDNMRRTKKQVNETFPFSNLSKYKTNFVYLQW